MADEAGERVFAAEKAKAALEVADMEAKAAAAAAAAAAKNAAWLNAKLRAESSLQVVLTRAERLRQSETLKPLLMELLLSLERDKSSATATTKRQQLLDIVEEAERQEASRAEAAKLAEAETVAAWGAWDDEEDDALLLRAAL